jgi:hypothetical protein
VSDVAHGPLVLRRRHELETKFHPITLKYSIILWTSLLLEENFNRRSWTSICPTYTCISAFLRPCLEIRHVWTLHIALCMIGNLIVDYVFRNDFHHYYFFKVFVASGYSISSSSSWYVKLILMHMRGSRRVRNSPSPPLRFSEVGSPGVRTPLRFSEVGSISPLISVIRGQHEVRFLRFFSARLRSPNYNSYTREPSIKILQSW